jgi:hypothetical protein
MNPLVVCDPVADAESLPLDQIDVSDPKYQNHLWQPYFARLRREDPVHWRQKEIASHGIARSSSGGAGVIASTP